MTVHEIYERELEDIEARYSDGHMTWKEYMEERRELRSEYKDATRITHQEGERAKR